MPLLDEKNRETLTKEFAQKYGVMGAPKIIVNEKSEVGGAVPEDLFVAHVLHAPMHQEPLQPR